VQSAQSYAQGGQWLAARQVRCVSAPWTSQAGDSAVAAVHRLAVAHGVVVSLQRVTAAGVVTVLSAQSGELPEGAVPGPFGGHLAVPSGSQPFAAGELWTRLQSSATGTPNWFAAGQGALFYSPTGSAAVVRSFQLVYNLTPADLGARLRCLASGEDGPAGAPTRAVFASPEYSVSSSGSCAPRKLAGANTTQPALVEPGRAPCLSAPSGPGALEGGQAAIAVAKGRAVIALSCALASGCRGTLSLSSGSVLAARGTIALGRGRSAILHVKLTAPGRRLVARAKGGVPVTLKLKTHAAGRTLGTARLLSVG
jgi:hypothetical protein